MNNTNLDFKNNNEVVEYLFRNNYFKFIAKSYNLTDDEKDDLISIAIVYLLEMNKNKLIDIYRRGKLLGYIKNLMYNQYISKNTKFTLEILTFRNRSTDINNLEDNSEDIDE